MIRNKHENPDVNKIIFEKGRDPGEGYLRIVGDFVKLEKIANDPTRSISFREIYEVMFSG